MNEYENKIIICKCYRYPKPAVQWMKDCDTGNVSVIVNTTDIFQNNLIYVVQSYIAFVKVTRNNSGTYSCVASSKYGRTNRNVSLEVFFESSIINFLNRTLVIYEGYQKYALSCTVQSNPKSKITWYMGDKAITVSGNNSEYEMEQDFISQNHKFTKISSTLTFKNVTRNYTGFCTCTAVNEIFEKIERKDNSVDSNV